MTKEQARGVDMRNTEERLQDLIDDIRRNKIKACELISEEGKYNLADDIETVLSMLKEKDAKIEHLEEKRNNQKAELAILNEKQKEMNKLINTVSSYKGMVKKEQKDNKKKDKIIDLMAERIEWLCKSNGILLDREHDENFTQEDIKQYFERKANSSEQN